MPTLALSYSHTQEDVSRTIQALDEALAIYRQALDEGVDKHLLGRPSQAVYRRYNHSDRRLSPPLSPVDPLADLTAAETRIDIS